MIIHEEPSPNSVSSPVSTAKDSRCYTVEDLMEMLLLSRPTVYRLLFDILNISREICYSLAGMRNPG